MPVGPDGMAHFRERVLPMWWSWSVHIVQALHLEVFRRVGLPGPFLQGKVPPGALCGGASVAACYIDNVASFVMRREQAEAGRDALVAASPPSLLGMAAQRGRKGFSGPRVTGPPAVGR